MIKFKTNKHFFITKYKSMICIEDIIEIAFYTDYDDKIYRAKLKGCDKEFNIDPDDQEKLVKFIKKLEYDKV